MGFGVAACAHAPSRFPRGPANVIGVVATGAHAVTARSGWPWPPCPPPGPCAVPGLVPAAVLAARARVGLRRDHPRRRGGADAQQREPPHRLPPRDDPVDVVLGDLFRQVPLQLSHPTSPVENVDQPRRRLPDGIRMRTRLDAPRAAPSAQRRSRRRASRPGAPRRGTRRTTPSPGAAARRACPRPPRPTPVATAPAPSASEQRSRRYDRLVPRVVAEPVDVARASRARARARPAASARGTRTAPDTAAGLTLSASASSARRQPAAVRGRAARRTPAPASAACRPRRGTPAKRSVNRPTSSVTARTLHPSARFTNLCMLRTV